MADVKFSKALIDGDLILFRSSASAEKVSYHLTETDNPRGITFASHAEMKYYIQDRELMEGDYQYVQNFQIAPFANARDHFDRFMLNIKEATKTEDYTLFIAGTGNFRYGIATLRPYKGTRQGKRKPAHLQALGEYAVEAWGAVVVDGMETDDQLGINQTEDTIICTIDKDLDMVPGWHYNWNSQEIYSVDKQEGMLTFYHQLLTGDSVDNIGGVRGIGVTKAALLLKGVTDEQELVDLCLKAYDGDEAALIENGALLWMKKTEEEDEFQNYIQPFLPDKEEQK